MPFVKSTGVTPTERLLAELCERSFLKLWSYPNPCKDDGKELCDLIAVFEGRIFIFFDRESRQFDRSDGDSQTQWGRWKRNVIDGQIKTAHGAERYIRSGRGIFLDRESRVPFPINVDPATAIVHKFVVAHGAAEACKQFSDQNVYGSLAVAYSGRETLPPFPFMVDLNKENPIHVFDSHNLPILFDELDTFFDFSAYLDAKVAAIRKYDCLTYCGEEDLLAHYFLNYDESSNRHVIGVQEEGINFFAVGEGEWKDFIQSGPYKRKKLADKDSYLWDELIQRTCQNALDGTMIGSSNLLRGKSAIHEMAKEPRFFRRELSSQIIKAINDFPETPSPIVRNLSFMPSFYKDKAYVFLQLKVDTITDYDNDYRPKRSALLELACASAKNKFGHLKKVVGIAIDAPKFSQRNSEDFLLLECENWSDEQRRHYEKANEGVNFFSTKNLIKFKRRATEFPVAHRTEPRRLRMPKIGRNDDCPCGSGKKYKRCCMPKGQ